MTMYTGGYFFRGHSVYITPYYRWMVSNWWVAERKFDGNTFKMCIRSSKRRSFNSTADAAQNRRASSWARQHDSTPVPAGANHTRVCSVNSWRHLPLIVVVVGCVDVLQLQQPSAFPLRRAVIRHFDVAYQRRRTHRDDVCCIDDKGAPVAVCSVFFFTAEVYN